MTDAVTRSLQAAVEAMRRQDYVTATRIVREVLAADRKCAAAHDVLSQIAFETGNSVESVEHLRAAVRLEPKVARYRTNLGRAYARLGKFREAHDQYDRALKLAPEDPISLAEKATIFERQNKYDRARRLLAPSLKRGAVSPPVASVQLRLLVHDRAFDEAIALGSAVLDAAKEPSAFLRSSCFELARAYERSGRYEEAFAAAVRANAMFAPPFDPAEDARRVDEDVAFFTRDRLRSMEHPPEPSDQPIFVLGMPRSGTTLVERILHAHPDVEGTGENALVYVLAMTLETRIEGAAPYPHGLEGLTAEQVGTLAASYLDALRDLAPKRRDAARLVDKSLDNTRYVGLIDVILPRARVVHCRRAAMDTCLSCFMEPLTPASTPYATDLTNLGLHYLQYERQMRHWHEVVDVPMLDVSYEQLTADPETETRRLIEFAGLEWDDACLRPHEVDRQDRTLSFDQVRKPIYRSSVGRADRFGPLLDRLRAALGDDAG
jgi:Tfp pilus assembly protein PilF